MSRIVLSNDPSPISGYKMAYIDMRSPNPSNETAFTVMDGTAQVAMTLTCGGTAAKWITATFKEAVTLMRSGLFNLFGSETVAAANATFGLELAEYTTSEQSAFVDTCYGSELGTTIEHRQHTVAPQNKAIAAGSRLVIKPTINAAVTAGVVGTGQGVSFQFNGADGTCYNAYLDFGEIILPGESQVGGGTAPFQPGYSRTYFQDLKNTVEQVLDSGLGSEDMTLQALKEEAENQRDLV